MNQPSDINALYRQLFGRDAEPAGQDFWQKQTAYAPSSNMRQAMLDSAQGTDATYAGNHGTSERDWAAYRKRAEQQTAGLNNMPGVFSDYGALAGATPEQAQGMMYHDKDSLQRQLDAFKSLFGVSSIDQLAGQTGTDNSRAAVTATKGR